MKKTILALCSGIIISVTAIAQPVSDRAVIPVAVTLNQILRLHVTDGGNIEFVFNTIDQYTNGILNSSFYNTNVVIASSTDWELNFGAEDAALMPTDEIGAATMPLNNVGFMVTTNGTNVISSVAGTATLLNNNADLFANGLGQFNVTASQNPMMSPGALGNGGDVAANDFTINWECGTLIVGGTVGMNLSTLLTQNLPPDRYVSNVLLDINSL